MQNVVFSYDYAWACGIHDWVFFQKNRFKKSSDEKQVFTLQVARKCCLSNVSMVLLSIPK